MLRNKEKIQGDGHFREVLSYQWDYYSELARQRKDKEDQIREILFEKAIDDFKFDRWQRPPEIT